MKMISEIYAKFIELKETIPKDSYVLSKLDKYEKNNLKNRPNTIIDNPEILRKFHIDFNNKHYLKAEFDSDGKFSIFFLGLIDIKNNRTEER